MEINSEDIKVKIVDREEDFFLLQHQWNLLIKECERKSLFLCWEWMYTWWEKHSQREKESYLFIITVYDSKEHLIGLLPLWKRKLKWLKFLPYTIIQILGTKFESSDYLTLLVREVDKERVVKAIFQFLEKYFKEIDIFQLSNVLAEDPFVNYLKEFAKDKKLYFLIEHFRVCPYINLPATFDNYILSLKRKMRYNLRSRSKKLFNQYQVEVEIVDNPTQVDEAIDDIFKLHHERWKQKKEKSIFDISWRKEFHKQISNLFSKEGILKIFFLKINSVREACLYCFEYNNTLMDYQTGFNPKWKKYGLGVILISHAIKYAIEKELSVFDFMRGEEEFKFEWTNTYKNMVICIIGVSTMGKMILYVLQIFLSLKNGIKQFIPSSLWQRMRGIARIKE